MSSRVKPACCSVSRPPSRSRDAAVAAVAKYTSKFEADAPLIATSELRQRLEGGERIILVDVRTAEEQSVSMIPGSVTQSTFEAEVLPKLHAVADVGQAVGKAWSEDEEEVPRDSNPLVVPYCTVGYRSGLYCRELQSKHGLSNVRNGEGILMWTFDGSGLVRPPTTPPLSATGYFQASSSSERHGTTAELVWSVHVFGDAWDIAADGYRTVRFSRLGGAARFIKSRLSKERALSALPWACVFTLIYLGFTPACGVMYDCGCRFAFSKWGQVEPCNVYTADAGRRCPWCSCSSLSCLLVAFDSKPFRGIFLFDLIPDGTFLAAVTVAVLLKSFRKVEVMSKQRDLRIEAIAAVKVMVGCLWFVLWCLLFGAIFFVFSPDYPSFLGYKRELPVSSSPPQAAGANGHTVDVFIRAQELHAQIGSYVVLDARSEQEALKSGVIPGAIVAPWQLLAEFSSSDYRRRSVLKPLDELISSLANVGVNGTRRIVVYGGWDQMWGEEGRLFWTLYYLGYSAVGLSCLEGGIASWRTAGLPVEAAPFAVISDSVSRGNTSRTVVQESARATTLFVYHLITTGRGVILDTRELTEFEGSRNGDPYGAARSGHIPTAVWYDWREKLFEPQSSGSVGSRRLRSCPAIYDSLPAKLASADAVVMYCTGGIRSGFVFMVFLACGIGNRPGAPKLMNYDGSWWAWAADAFLDCEGTGMGCALHGATSQAVSSSTGGSGAGFR